MFRLFLGLVLSLFLVGFTSVEGRMTVLSLQSKFGLERLCEDETTHVTPAELRTDVIKRGKMPFRPVRKAARAWYRSIHPPETAWRPQAPRGPPHCPRGPPFAA